MIKKYNIKKKSEFFLYFSFHFNSRTEMKLKEFYEKKKSIKM